MYRFVSMSVAALICVVFPAMGFSQHVEDGDAVDDAHFDLVEFEFDDAASFESEVVARKLPATASETRITAARIAQRLPTCTDEALTLASGITVVQHGAEGKGHQLFLRGFDAAHGSDVEVTMDGVSLNEPSNIHGSGYLDLYGIIPETIVAMTVHKGPFLPFQGNFATGGTIAFELGAPEAYRNGLLRTELDFRGRTRAVALIADDEDARRFVAMDGVYDPGFGPDREAVRTSVLAKYSVQVRSAIRFEALASGQLADFSSPGTMALDDVTGGTKGFYHTYNTQGHGKMQRLLLQSSLVGKSARTNWRIRFFGIRRSFLLADNYTGYLLYPNEGDLRQQQHNAVTFGSAFSLTHRPKTTQKFSLVTGGGWRSDQLSQSENQLTEQGRVWRTNLSADAILHHLNVYAGLEWSPFVWLSVQPSVRLDGALYDVTNTLDKQHGKQNFTHFSPRMTIAFPLTEKISLFGAMGNGFRLPEARSILNDRGTEDVDLSRYRGGSAAVAWGYAGEAGFQWQPVDAVRFKAVGYLTAMQKEMVFDHVSGTNLEKNPTRRVGSEMEIVVEATRWFTSSVDASAVWARFLASGNKIPGIPEALVNVRTQVGKSRGANGGIDMRLVGRRHLAHGAFVNGYVWGMLRGGWRFDRLDVTAVAENIFFQRIMVGAYHYASRFEDSDSELPKIHYAAARPFSVRLVLTVLL